MGAERANQKLGYLLAAGAATLWGVSGVVARYLIGSEHYAPAELLFFRTSLASIIIVVWTARSSRETGLWRILPGRVERGDILAFMLLGTVGLVVNQGCYYLALSHIEVGYVLLFQYLAPIMMMAYGVATKTESITGGKLLSAAMSIIGCALMVVGSSGGERNNALLGTIFAIGSGIGFSFYAIVGQRLQRRYTTPTMMSYAFIGAATMWALINPVWALPWSQYRPSSWIFFIYLGAIATALPFALFLRSLRYLEPSRSGLTSMVEPVVAATVAWLWLGESLGPVQIAGGAAVIGGVLLLQFIDDFPTTSGGEKRSAN